MKQRALFNLNILGNELTHVFVILPDIINTNFDIISMCVEFLNRYKKLTFICPEVEYTFYKLIFNFSETFTSYKNIEVEPLSELKLQSLQTKNCLIVSLREKLYFKEIEKKAICCSITEDSDFIFTDLETQSQYFTADYLKHLLKFLHIPSKRLFSSIDISPETLTASSNIAKTQPDDNYNVMILSSFLNTFKLSRFLRKNKLIERLVVISKNKLHANDPMLSTYKEYDILDLIAMQLHARNISMSDDIKCQNILNSFRINLQLHCMVKDSYFLIRDISAIKV